MVSETRKAQYRAKKAAEIVAALSPGAQRFVTAEMLILAMGKIAPVVFLTNYADSRRFPMDASAYRTAAKMMEAMGF